ncbi:hypothetical protein HMPREF9713_00192 [Myroides odoratimimus CCUG 12700]|uniref:hypothetical protein n=1 Tax=Myroides odoratimimus TaxID=76832 RepID=UPI0003531B0C|nr:hypothetical protein [Myroides odoratimimus]EPH13992.1 hypothetical protein HMPREF9713_00192 [Myroides odoratimimus CCUG 12700]
MKKKLLFAGVAFMALSTMQAQDGIGIGKSIIPDGTAVLDVGSDTKGVLIPRVFLTGEKDITTIKGGIYPESLLVYHKAKLPTDVLKSGFYFWDGTLWRALMSKSSEHLSETLTKLGVKQEAGETVLVYKAEDGKDTEIEISKELQSSTNFETWIKDLVTSAATKVKVEEGTGIKVDEAPPVNGQITYTVNADPSGITLGGDVSGKADNTSVDKIKGVEVTKANPATDKDLALVYDGTKWTPGKPKVDGDDITDKKDLKGSDGTIVVDKGTGAVLVETDLKVGLGTIKDTHLATDAANNDKYLTTDKDGKPTWQARNESVVAQGSGVTVATSGKVDGVTTYTVSADFSEIDLIGDVSGKADNTSVDKIKGVEVTKANPATDKDLALVYDGTKWTPGKPKVDGNNITDKKELKVLDGISITNGKASVLNDVTIGIGNNSVMPIKISAEDKANQVLVTSDDGTKVEWVPQSNIKTTGADLTTDGIIVVGDATTGTQLATGALLEGVNLSIKKESIDNDKIAPSTLTIDKLATVPEKKNMHLVTDTNGKPQWETLKGGDIKITTKPIATNETVEGQRVYTVRIINGEVETPPGTSLTYNSEIKAIPLSNIDYLLTAHIYDSSNKLLINGVTDVTNSKNTSVKFRFGSGNFYNTLPVAKNYIVVLKYVSTEIVTP